MADVVIVVAITNPEAKSAAHGISLFLVEDGMKGFVKGRKLEKIGFKAQVLLGCKQHDNKITVVMNLKGQTIFV